MTDMTIQSQLDQVLALVRGMPCRCMSVAQLGERDPGCDKCEATEKLEAIRAAVGGEAVAWAHKDGMRILQDDGEGSLYLTSDRQDEYGQTIPLYASPPATVDVGAIRALIPTADDLSPRGDELDGIRRVGQIEMIEEIRRRVNALIGKEA